MRNAGTFLWRTSLLLSLLVAAVGCRGPVTTSAPLVVAGYTGTVQVARSDSDALGNAVTVIGRTMSDVTALLDPQNAEGELAKFNRVGGSVRLPVSRTLFRALDLARHYHELTGGIFDITTGQLATLWEVGIPTEQVRLRALEKSGMKHIEISENGGVALTLAGVAVSPGHYALAYALDMAMVERRKHGEAAVLATLPYFARRDGRFPIEQPPVVPIMARGLSAHPLVGVVDLSHVASLAMVHSAASNPGAPIVMDPRNGLPATDNRLAVVIGPLTIKAYALAQALYIAGPDKGRELLDAFPDYEAMLIPEGQPLVLWMTRGFEAAFTPEPFYRGKSERWEARAATPTR
ncbi:MAG TPA: FAD:protein FMN transferase [Kiritimatiellia bacterium]|nr:FAD:protein FMN transferase [Kiritimatiellia bacterium]HMP33692.1 FAD:protein FMN transferase [Kiritimatiellia bacterium]